MASLHSREIADNPMQLMLNHSAFFDALLQGRGEIATRFLLRLCNGEGGSSPGLGHFVSKSGETFECEPLTRLQDVFVKFINRHGFDWAMLYLLHRRSLKLISALPVQAVKEKAALFESLGVSLGMIREFPSLISPNGLFEPEFGSSDMTLEMLDTVSGGLFQEMDNPLAFPGAWPSGELAIALPRLISGELALELSRLVDESRFVRREHDVEGVVDHDIQYGPLHAFLEDMMNAPTVLSAVSELAGLSNLKRFVGRLMLLSEASGHEEWHRVSSSGNRRRLGFSLNLSPQPFKGGELAIRQCGHVDSGQTLAMPDIGDGVLFRISDNFEHRALPVLGEVPRIAFVGWFAER